MVLLLHIKADNFINFILLHETVCEFVVYENGERSAQNVVMSIPTYSKTWLIRNCIIQNFEIIQIFI
jgi:hypothetical protein